MLLNLTEELSGLSVQQYWLCPPCIRQHMCVNMYVHVQVFAKAQATHCMAANRLQHKEMLVPKQLNPLLQNQFCGQQSFQLGESCIFLCGTVSHQADLSRSVDAIQRYVEQIEALKRIWRTSQKEGGTVTAV